MPKPRFTAKQLEALDECAHSPSGRLYRRTDGWSQFVHGFGAHSFQTVRSLIERGALDEGVASPGGRRLHAVTITRLGRDALK